MNAPVPATLFTLMVALGLGLQGEAEPGLCLPGRPAAAVSLVSFIPVSVSVRPDRLSESGTIADAGHHSRSCADFLLPGLPGTALASVTLAVASRPTDRAPAA